MNYETLKFNGETKEWLYVVEGREKAPFPAIKREIMDIPGMDGAHLTGTQLEPLIISQPVGFKVKSDADELSLKDELASWLYTQKPKPLVLPTEPDRTYYAVVQNTLDDFERMATLRQGTIEFLCVDPFAYGEEEEHSLQDVTLIPNDGTANSYPIFDLTMMEDSTLISIGNISDEAQDGGARSIYIGTEEEAEDEQVERKTLVMQDTMQSTSSWTGPASVDSGYIDGTFATDENGFYAESWGSEDESLASAVEKISDDIRTKRNDFNRDLKGKEGELKKLEKKKKPDKEDKKEIKKLKGEINDLNDKLDNLEAERKERLADARKGKREWVGPSLEKALPYPLNSFQADIKIANMNHTNLDGDKVSPESVGIIEVYMRDANDNKICKITLGDSFSNAIRNYGMFEGDGDRHRLKNGKWNQNFDGILRVTRESYMFTPYIAFIKDGKHIASESIDNIHIGDTVSENPVTKIQVAMRKYLGARRMWQRIKEVKVYEVDGVYDNIGTTVPVEFKRGDKVVIDVRNQTVTINGEMRRNLFHLDTDFFTMVEGLNQLETSENFEGTVKFRKRYL